MEERDFFDERPESKPANIYCPFCRQTHSYSVRWLRRTKKKSIPARATDLDRARFAKARDYLVRVDDKLRCQTPRCGKMIEISSLQSVVFL
jgi:ribosomal protein L44E